MNLLALLAMLFLLAAPSLGALADVLDDSDGIHDRSCAAVCMKMTNIAHSKMPSHHPQPAVDSSVCDDMTGAGCVYCCTLLAGMAVLLLCLLCSPLNVRSRAPSSWRAVERCARFYPRGLGSRGPPIGL